MCVCVRFCGRRRWSTQLTAVGLQLFWGYCGMWLVRRHGIHFSIEKVSDATPCCDMVFFENTRQFKIQHYMTCEGFQTCVPWSLRERNFISERRCIDFRIFMCAQGKPDKREPEDGTWSVSAVWTRHTCAITDMIWRVLLKEWKNALPKLPFTRGSTVRPPKKS